MTMQCHALTFVPLGQSTVGAFETFLRALASNSDQAFFHPHPFDAAAARTLVALSESGADEYWLLMADEVLAYGMLRGWEAGYEVPSLGLAVAPAQRGKGFARSMMQHLHARAEARGARQVRLKVDRRNLVARRLYESLGYVFQDHSAAELLGLLSLDGRSRRAA